MKRILFSLLPAVFVWFGSLCTATAQDESAQSDQITQNQQIIQNDFSSNGEFQPVTVDPSSPPATVNLQFPVGVANKPVGVYPLDGGTLGIDGNSAVIDQNGMLSFPFLVGDQPGLYRVIVIDPNADADSTRIVGVVQFEVPNPPE